MYIKYHCIAIKSRGPKLRMELPSSLPVHPRMDILPAIDYLKNYSKEDIDETALTNQNITTKHNLGNLGNDDLREKCLDIMAEELCSATRGHIHDQFSQSISDSAFEGMTDSKLPCTRDRLKQMIEGACLDFNQIGELGINKFIRHLTELCAFCNEKWKYFNT
jgi:hypothetical protein